MKFGHEALSAIRMTAWSHPATRDAGGLLPPAYPGRSVVKPPVFATPAFAPWTPHTRFAPPGPSRATLKVPGISLIPADPAFWRGQDAPTKVDEASTAPQPLPIVDGPTADGQATADWLQVIEDVAPSAPGAPSEPLPLHTPFWRRAEPSAADESQPYAEPELPEAESEQPTDKEADREPATEQDAEPKAWTVAEPDPVVTSAAEAPPAKQPLPEEPLPVEEAAAAEAPAAARAAYWAIPPEPVEDADGALPAETSGAPRPTPAMAGLWSVEPAPGTTQDLGALPRSQVVRPRRRRFAQLAAGIAILLGLCVAGVLVLPRLLTSSGIPAATFNAPMMVLRAAIVGRVASVAVTSGQSVEPSTLLLTIHTDPQPDPAASLLQDRLEAARGRLAALDEALAQPVPNTDAGRSRLADLRRERAAAANDVAQLQDGVAHLPAKPPADQPVRAGIHGVVRSLEAQAGTATASGVPLVRMLDCDHAFLTVGPNPNLRPGEAVQVRLPNLPAVPATVRNSSGVAEPPNTLVIAPAPGAFVSVLSGSCPVGATATITPSMTGS